VKDSNLRSPEGTLALQASGIAAIPTIRNLVRDKGFEPLRPDGHELLELACLPFHQSRNLGVPGGRSNPRLENHSLLCFRYTTGTNEIGGADAI
jgi:hypothetical protein